MERSSPLRFGTSNKTCSIPYRNLLARFALQLLRLLFPGSSISGRRTETKSVSATPPRQCPAYNNEFPTEVDVAHWSRAHSPERTPVCNSIKNIVW